mgnify:CR=1 FL=1
MKPTSLVRARAFGAEAVRSFGEETSAALRFGYTSARRHSCAFVNQIYNFKEIDDRTAIIQTSPRRSFRVTFFNNCREMRWAFSARVEARPGICLSAGDKMIFGHNGFQDRCIISSVEPLPRKTNTSY